ncbi:hypothetical protein [Oceaniferula spumae]
MKKLLTLILSAAVIGLVHADPLKKDPVEKGLREAYDLYKKRNYGEVSDKLRELLKLLDEKNQKRAEVVLPEEVESWKGGDLVRENLDALGGGLSVKRHYKNERKNISVKLIKDSPIADNIMKLLTNDDLVALSKRKTHTVSGIRAVMENPRKLQMVIGDEILLEVVGDKDTDEQDVVGFTRKLDINLMKKMK